MSLILTLILGLCLGAPPESAQNPSLSALKMRQIMALIYKGDFCRVSGPVVEGLSETHFLKAPRPLLRPGPKPPLREGSCRSLELVCGLWDGQVCASRAGPGDHAYAIGRFRLVRERSESG